jgi:ATP phosphoribosyltransferase regulatory subunit
VTLDLGEVRGFDYYTGLRLRVWVPGAGEPVARGGRYDELLARYGVHRPAVGFAIDLDLLETALAAAGVRVDARPRAPVRLVALDPRCGDVAAQALALEQARLARSRGARSWVEPGLRRAEARAAAEQLGGRELVVVAPNRRGVPVPEHWRRGPGGWRRMPPKPARRDRA